MRKYTLFMVLLFSFLLPLQVAASTILSAPSCPAKSTMATVVADQVADDCCNDDGKMDCQQMPSCHGCSPSVHLFSLAIPVFNFTADKRFYLGIVMPLVALFDPASVWRPPTNA